MSLEPSRRTVDGIEPWLIEEFVRALWQTSAVQIKNLIFDLHHFVKSDDVSI